ncbi:MAG: glycosyltransferase [Thermomicrobiales bacterium]
MNDRPLTILLATDVFPPRCGGSGWSTYHLARALRARGHRPIVARPRDGLRGARRAEYDGLPVHELGVSDRGTRVPLARGVTHQELFWPRFGRFLADLARREGADLIHGQHLLSIPAAVSAGRALGRPVVATVRDYWPVCPIATRLQRCPDLPHCSPACQVCCLSRGRAALRPVVRALQPHVRANLTRRQRALLDAACTIAVSTHVANVLCEFIPALTPEVIPNFITLDGEFVEQEEPRDERLVLYVGKLEPHKGADLLPDALAAAPGARLVVAGSGPLDGFVARECAARGVPVELRGELPHDEVMALMRAADVLIFPARWEEPLTRTLLEAGACALPVVALATGGTPDIIADGETGLLATEPAGLGLRLAALLADPARRARLGAAARTRIAAHFSEAVVVPHVEALYRRLVAAVPAGAP